MGAIFEELMGKFNEALNENPGKHFMPRDVVQLMVDLLLAGDRRRLAHEGVLLSVYDPCCGSGGRPTIAKGHVTAGETRGGGPCAPAVNPGADIQLFGQEVKPETFRHLQVRPLHEVRRRPRRREGRLRQHALERPARGRRLRLHERQPALRQDLGPLDSVSIRRPVSSSRRSSPGTAAPSAPGGLSSGHGSFVLALPCCGKPSAPFGDPQQPSVSSRYSCCCVLSLIPSFDEETNKSVGGMDGETCVPRLKPIGPTATSMSGAGMRAERPDTVHDRIEAGEDLFNIVILNRGRVEPQMFAGGLPERLQTLVFRHSRAGVFDVDLEEGLEDRTRSGNGGGRIVLDIR